MLKHLCLLSLLAFLALSPLSLAWSAEGDAPEQHTSEQDLKYFINVYSWMPSLSGSFKTATETHRFSAGFASDLLPSLEFGAMFHTELLYRERFGISTDFFYTRLYSEKKRPFFKLTSEQGLLLADIMPYYRIGTFTTGDSLNTSIALDIMAGIRIWYLDMELKTYGPFANRRFFTQQAWVDPLVAGRVIFTLDEDWMITLRGGIGGFEASSHLTWDAIAFIGYHVNDWFMINIGYKAVGFDYTVPSDRNPRVNMILHGPFIGFGFWF